MEITQGGWKCRAAMVLRLKLSVGVKADVLPAEWGDVFDHVGRRSNAVAIEVGESRFEIERVEFAVLVHLSVEVLCSLSLSP